MSVKSYFDKTYFTQRLHLVPLNLEHADFIKVLVNTPDWLIWIGDRNVHDEESSKAYIINILKNPDAIFWVACRKNDSLPMGVITLIQRDYLSVPDIGFAFLPDYYRQGFAYEATKEILNQYQAILTNNAVGAITLPRNTASVRLLEKLNFRFVRQVEHSGNQLMLYQTAVGNR